MSIYDFVILGVIAVSALFGLMRGGVREIIDLFSIIIAVVVDGLLAGFTQPLARKFIHPDFVGDIAALVVVFAILYIGVRWAGARIGQRLHQNQELNGVDRTLGAGFGVLRGLVVIGAIHLFMVVATPAQRMPTWFSHAKLYGLSAKSAKLIQFVLPHAARAADVVAPTVEKNVRAGASDHPHSGAAPATVYDAHQRAGMDTLVEKSR